MEDEILEMISKITKISIAELKVQKDDFNIWDSLKHMEIIMSIEEEFDIVFEQEDIASTRTVSAMIAFVVNKVS